MGSKPKFGDLCTECKTELNIGNCVWRNGDIRPICLRCSREYQRNYAANNKDKRKHNALKQYGISLVEYRQKVELQLGGCAICKQPCKTGQQLSIDHDHITNQVRDLLCSRCNVVLGMCGEDEALLFAMIEYLKRHQVEKAG